MWITRQLLKDGINGITDEYKKLYGIKIKDECVSINDEMYIPLKAIQKVQESQVEYEIWTKGTFVNLSKTQKLVQTLVRC